MCKPGRNNRFQTRLNLAVEAFERISKAKIENIGESFSAFINFDLFKKAMLNDLLTARVIA